MAKVKIDDASFNEIELNVEKAIEAMTEAEEIWGTNFDNLYNWFVTSGFLDQLYEDAESNYYALSSTCNCVSSALGGAVLGCSFGPIGGIIGFVIGLVLGITTTIIGKPQWLTASKEVFVQLLTDCCNGNDDAYIQGVNVQNMMTNIQVGLEAIRTTINDFNHDFANLENAMNALQLKGQMAGDGVTMLGVETTVTIDGQEITTSVSEAMNAFFTYSDVVINTEIEADYLERTYGIEVDYKALMNGFSGFMTNTLNSGLYSHEFVDVLVPAYVAANPNIKEDAYEQVAGEMGTTSDKVKSILGELGLTGLGISGALLGSSLLDLKDLDEEKKDDDDDDNKKDDDDNKKDDDDNKKDDDNNKKDDDDNSGGGTPRPTTPDPTEDDNTGNDLEIDKPEELELPEELKAEMEKDYDDLAREAYEAQGSEAISQKRFEMIDEINQNFNNGDLSMYDEKLAGYGYDQAAIAALKVDRDMLITALVLGDERSTLAALAQDLAKADGVTDFKSQYSTDAKYESLSNGESSETLVNMSDNPTIQEKREAMKTAEKEYTEAVDGAKESYDKVVADKKAMEDAYNAAKEKYGEDTSKWSEADAKSYNELVKNYNESAKAYQEKAATIETAKTNYQTARDEYNVAKDTFLETIRSENDISGGSTQTPTDQGSTSTIYQGDEGNQAGAYREINDGSSSIGISDEEILNSINN